MYVMAYVYFQIDSNVRPVNNSLVKYLEPNTKNWKRAREDLVVTDHHEGHRATKMGQLISCHNQAVFGEAKDMYQLHVAEQGNPEATLPNENLRWYPPPGLGSQEHF